MADRRRWELANGCVVTTVFTDRHDGDLSVDGPVEVLRERRASLAPGPWTWLRQVHGATVVVVGRPGEGAGRHADASVTAAAGAVLSVQVADCAPVLLWAPHGEGAVVAAAHAGWRGLRDGVLGAVLEELGGLGIGAGAVRWVLGPCISPAVYEFRGPELDGLVDRFGPSVRAVTDAGAPSLDLRAAVAAGLREVGVGGPVIAAPPVCTAVSPDHWSYRAAGAAARQAGVVWWEPPS